MLGLFYPYGFLLQAIAILHFVRRRPDTYWLWIILMGGALGALVYIAIEVVPDAGLLRGAFQVFPRRKRIKELEAAILDNPSVGNYEELGDLYLDDLQFARGRECYDRVLARSDSIDALYRRGLCEIALDDYTAAATDLQHVTERDPKYDYQRAAGLHAHALAKIGRARKGGRTLCGGHGDVDAVGNPIQLRLLPRFGGALRGGSRMGGAHPAQEGDDAGLHPPA